MKINNLFFLDEEMFNNKFLIKGMTANSICCEDFVDNNQQFMVHRNTLNKVLKANKPLPCMLVEREYQGKTQLWLATMSTL